MSENTKPEDLPEFLNTEPDTTEEGLICTENGERISWEDLDRAVLVTEEGVKPEEQEKKYRPYSIAEFLKLYQVGDIVDFRAKNCDEFYRAMFIGYITNSDRSMDEKPGEIDVMLGNYLYSLSHLFENYELFFEDEWQPFGVEEASE